MLHIIDSWMCCYRGCTVVSDVVLTVGAAQDYFLHGGGGRWMHDAAWCSGMRWRGQEQRLVLQLQRVQQLQQQQQQGRHRTRVLV